MATKKKTKKPLYVPGKIEKMGGNTKYIDTPKERDVYNPLPPEDELFTVPDIGTKPLSAAAQKKEDEALAKHFLTAPLLLPPKQTPKGIAAGKKQADAVHSAIKLTEEQKVVQFGGGSLPQQEIITKAFATLTGENPKDTFINEATHLRTSEAAAIVAEVLGATNNPLEDLPEEEREEEREEEGGGEALGEIPRDGADVERGDFEWTTDAAEWEMSAEDAADAEHRALMEKAAREEATKHQTRRERTLFLKTGIKPQDIPAGIKQAIADVYGETEELTTEDLKAFARLPQDHQEQLLLPTAEQFATLEEFEGAGYNFNDTEGNAITDREERRRIFNLWKNPPELPEGQEPEGINLVGLGGSLVAELGAGI
jgi:hypothetical protein